MEITGDEEYMGAWCAADPRGRLVVVNETRILFYGTDGSLYASVEHERWKNLCVYDFAPDGEERLYLCIGWGEGSWSEYDHNQLVEIDIEGAGYTVVDKEFPRAQGICVCAGETESCDLLLYDQKIVYGYDLETAGTEKLFTWEDCGIYGDSVREFGMTEDGRIHVEERNYRDRTIRLLFLTRTPADQAARRENLVLASVNGGTGLDALVSDFNRKYPGYHAEVRRYGSLTDLYNAFLTKEPIDLVDLSGVNIQRLNAQGIFQDLTPYLESSDRFGSGDIMEGILDAYTFEGILVGIPDTFTLRTVMGDRAVLAGADALTLDSLFAAAEAHPGAIPIDTFDGMTREDAMQYLMMFNEDLFVDWDTGDCRFDTGEFQKVLELVKRYPESIGGGEDEDSLPTKVQKGEVLFILADLETLHDYQLYEGIYGENVARLGIPDPEGSRRVLLLTGDAYAMTTASEHKEGAWLFIESTIQKRTVD